MRGINQGGGLFRAVGPAAIITVFACATAVMSQQARSAFGGRYAGWSPMPATAPSAAGIFNLDVRDDSLIAPPAEMAGNYQMLNSRSIFRKGRQAAPASPSPLTVPQAQYVLVGLTDTNGALVAHIENLTAGKITDVRAGETIAQGRVTFMNLDELRYESGGRARQVAIGENFLGNRSAASGAAGFSGEIPGPYSDVLMRMRERHIEENNGGQ